MPRRLSSISITALLALTAATWSGTAAQEASPAACPPPSLATLDRVPGTAASPVADGPAARIDAAIRAIEARGAFSGSVLIAQGEEILLEAGYGLADRACQIPNTPETTFRIGSITKQFTAAAIMQLSEAGKLSVDDPITTHLPDFPRPEGDGVPITIHLLLSHTSGLPELFTVYNAARQDEWPASVREVVYTIARDHELDFTPGTSWSYSNTGYLALGLIIEAVAGQSYEEFVREHLFEPAGMTSSGFEASGDSRPHASLGYRFDDANVISDVTRLDIAWSAGGIFSTAGDLHRWNQALTSGQLISLDSLTRMETPVAESYGYGLVIGDVEGHRVIWHGGGIDGFISLNERIPDLGIELIVLTNQESAGAKMAPIESNVLEELAPA